MTRFTVDRSIVRAEVERRKAVAPAAPVPGAPVPAPPASPAPSPRWSAKVFIVPAAVAEAIARLATRTLFGPPNASPVGEPHSMRRHRGVYIWRPTMDQQGRPDALGEILHMTDEHTAETEIAKINPPELH
jgi:hypothetical protein